MFFRCDVAKHCTSIPSDVGGSDSRGDVIVSWGNIGSQWSKRVEGGFVAPFDLFLHVFLDEVKWNVAGAFVHDLAALCPCAGGEFSLNFELGELGVVIGIGYGAGAKTVTDGETHIVGCADVANFIPVAVEEAFLLVSETPLGHDRSTS